MNQVKIASERGILETRSGETTMRPVQRRLIIPVVYFFLPEKYQRLTDLWIANFILT